MVPSAVLVRIANSLFVSLAVSRIHDQNEKQKKKTKQNKKLLFFFFFSFVIMLFTNAIDD
jgi:uncharacterized membrane protein YadS